MHSAPFGPLPHAYWQSGNTAQINETTVGGVLRATAFKFPGRTALAFGGRRWSYADLLAEAEDGARALLASFTPGDVVGIWAENCPEWITLEFAAGMAGLTLIPLHPSASIAEITYALSHSAAKGIFIATNDGDSSRAAILRSLECQLPSLKCVISLSEWDALRAIGSADLPWSVTSLPEVDPGSPAQILYTSGTTGRPKATLLTHRGLTNNARLTATAFGGREGDVIVNPMPLSSMGGCGLLTLGVAQIGATHVLMTEFDPAAQLTLIEEHHGTFLCGDPEMLATIGSHATFKIRNLGSVRAVASGGAQLPPDLALHLETVLGVPVLTALAQTECGAIAATTPRDALADRLGCVGRPLPGTEVKIADLRTGDIAGCGATGEICVRGYQVMRGYLDDPAATAAAIDADGWLRTGDLGALDERGYLRVAGRLRDLIVRGGEHVYPREIEKVLLEHPDVAEAAVVGVQDKFWGETVAAVVRLGSSLERAAATLSEYCGARLAPHKVPVRWLLTRQFPRTADGKIRKHVLRAGFADTAGMAWTSETAAELAGHLAVHHDDPPDLTGSAAELFGPRVPRQERRAKALEDIDR
jgi:acyl-CoA synthetase (AMP-forming)/AMP-acid ligase II